MTLLYPLYEKDLELGRIDPQSAVDLLSMLWLKIGDHVPMVPKAGEQLFGGSGSNQAITIGGVDEEGKDAVNDLTYIMLRAIELMLLRDPNLNARYHIGVNSSEYLRRLCQVNISTRATPAIHNDLAVFESLTSKGDTLEQGLHIPEGINGHPDLADLSLGQLVVRVIADLSRQIKGHRQPGLSGLQ